MKFYMMVGMLSILGIYIFFQEGNRTINDRKVTIPEIVIPPKSIDFTIEKNSTGIITFSGNFSKEETPKKIFSLIFNDKIIDNIIINSNLEYNNNIFALLYKILPIIENNYTIWLIRYDKGKLLIEGNAKTLKSKEQIDAILAYSTVNSFNNTKVNMKNKFESSVKRDDDLSEDDIESIISNLEKVVLIKKDADKQNIFRKDLKIVKKELQVVKNELTVVNKVIKVVRDELNILKKDDKKKKFPNLISIKNTSTEVKDAQYFLSENMVDEDIISLPMVKTVDMDIEDKIDKGILSPLQTKKPLIKEETIFMESSEDQISDSIPWAKLHDLDEELDGIVLDEIVASPVGF